MEFETTYLYFYNHKSTRNNEGENKFKVIGHSIHFTFSKNDAFKLGTRLVVWKDESTIGKMSRKTVYGSAHMHWSILLLWAGSNKDWRQGIGFSPTSSRDYIVNLVLLQH